MKKISQMALAATLGAMLALGGTAFAAEGAAVAADVTPSAGAVASEALATAPKSAETATEQPLEVAPLTYQYRSKEYGYTLNCPAKPQVITADNLYPGRKGEVLIFSNEGYDIKNAWVVFTDAFDPAKVPDYNTMTGDEAKSYLTDLVAANGYEGAMVVNLSPTNKAVYAVTAREMAVDTDGDGKADATVTASSQNAVAFFRLPSGKCYSLLLIDNPELRESAIIEFQQGLLSFTDK